MFNPPVGAYWRYYGGALNGPGPINELLLITKDTIINGIPAKKALYKQKVRYQTETNDTIYFFTRNDSAFYSENKNLGDEYFLFHFNLVVGSQFMPKFPINTSGCNPTEPYTVTSIEIQNINGVDRKVFNLSIGPPHFQKAKMAETIGPIDHHMFWTQDCFGEGPWYQLVCYHDNTGTYPDNVDCDPFLSIEKMESISISIHPNPSSKEIHLEFPPVKVESVIMYDQTGRVVKTIPTGTSIISKLSIPISELNDGLYLIHLHSNGKLKGVGEIIIKH